MGIGDWGLGVGRSRPSQSVSVHDESAGALLTVILWIMVIGGFSVYLKFGNMDRLYGALSAIIVFLLWLYVLTTCFVVGVIFNSERVSRLRRPSKTDKRKTHKKAKTPQTIRDEK